MRGGSRGADSAREQKTAASRRRTKPQLRTPIQSARGPREIKKPAPPHATRRNLRFARRNATGDLRRKPRPPLFGGHANFARHNPPGVHARSKSTNSALPDAPVAKPPPIDGRRGSISSIDEETAANRRRPEPKLRATIQKDARAPIAIAYQQFRATWCAEAKPPIRAPKHHRHCAAQVAALSSRDQETADPRRLPEPKRRATIQNARAPRAIKKQQFRAPLTRHSANTASRA